ncbi:MAG: hypothetical protein Kow0063_10170 [Anaerolineae bacterium]
MLYLLGVLLAHFIVTACQLDDFHYIQPLNATPFRPLTNINHWCIKPVKKGYEWRCKKRLYVTFLQGKARPGGET